MAEMPGDPLSGVELLIFDFDGVVADSEVISLSTLQKALSDHGVTLPMDQVRAAFLGTSLSTIVAYLRDQGLAPVADAFGDAWQAALFDRFKSELTAMPEIERLLDHLEASGRRYCIASSGSHERIARALDAIGLTHRFAHIFSAEDVTHGKPAPDLFLHAVGRMNTSYATALVLEDSPLGIEAALSAGIRSFGFVAGSHLDSLTEEHAALLLAKGAERVIFGHEELIAKN